MSRKGLDMQEVRIFGSIRIRSGSDLRFIVLDFRIRVVRIEADELGIWIHWNSDHPSRQDFTKTHVNSQNIHLWTILTRVGKNVRTDTDNFVNRSMKTFTAVAALIFGWVGVGGSGSEPTMWRGMGWDTSLPQPLFYTVCQNFFIAYLANFWYWKVSDKFWQTILSAFSFWFMTQIVYWIRQTVQSIC